MHHIKNILFLCSFFTLLQGMEPPENKHFSSLFESCITALRKQINTAPTVQREKLINELNSLPYPVKDSLLQYLIERYSYILMKYSPAQPSIAGFIPPINTVENANTIFTCGEFTPDGKYILFGSDVQCYCYLIDITTHECKLKFGGYKGIISCLAISNDGNYALVGTRHNKMQVWSLETGICLQEHTLPSTPVMVTFSNDKDSMNSIVITTDKRITYIKNIVSSSPENTVIPIPNGQPTHFQPSMAQGAFNPDKTQFAVASQSEQAIELVSLRDGSIRHIRYDKPGHAFFNVLTYSKDGNFLYLADGHGFIYVANLTTDKIDHEIRLPGRESVLRMTTTHNEHYALVTTFDNYPRALTKELRLRILDLKEHTFIKDIALGFNVKNVKAYTPSLITHPKGHYALSVFLNGTAYLFDIHSILAQLNIYTIFNIIKDHEYELPQHPQQKSKCLIS